MEGKVIRNYFIFALLFIFSLTRCSGSHENNHQQIILILLDAARPDHFSCNGYSQLTTPEMDQLVKKGVFFTNCYSQGLVTQTALPCFLYSRYFMPPIFPNHHSIPFESPGNLFRGLDSEAVSIPKALEKEGFLTAAIVAHEWITEGTKFAREFEELYNLHDIVEYEKKYAYPRAEKVIDFTINWVDKNKEKDFFLYIHIMDTHFPHFFEEDAKSFFGDKEYDNQLFAPWGLPINAHGEFSEEDLRYLNAMYDGSLRYTDRQVGRLFDFLERSQLLDDILIMITADHGEFLLEKKGMVSHGGSWYDPVAKIPLIIYFPKKVKTQVNSDIAELIDIGPTLLGLVGVELPEGKKMDGENLLAKERMTLERAENKTKNKELRNQQAAFVAMGDTGVRDEKYKCLFNWPPGRLLGASSLLLESALDSGLELEIYDLVQDPQEKEPLIMEREEEVFQRMFELYRKRLIPLYKRYETSTTEEQPELAFAISASSFQCDPEISYHKEIDSINAVIGKAGESGWLRRSSWDNSWLYADSSAGQVRISFPVPNGEYLLSFDINGCCEVNINGLKKTLCSSEFEENMRWKTNKVIFGPVEIKDKALNAVINPVFKTGEENKEAGDWFAVRLIGFEPIIDGQIQSMKEKDKEKEMMERLRTLGYIK